MLTDRRRARAAAAGLAVATTAWVVAGLRTPGYDPVEKSLSQLQRAGTGTRPLMTVALAAFGLALLAAAPVLGRALRSLPARRVLQVAGVATLTGAAFPLSAQKGLPQDLPHMVAATVGYTCVSLLPLLGGRCLPGRAGLTSYAVGGLTTAAMLATVPLHAVSGGLQRAGLTLGTGWVVAVVLGATRSGRDLRPVDR